MTKAHKIKAAKLRAKIKDAQKREVANLEAHAAHLRSQTLGLARTSRTKQIYDAYEASKMPQYARQRPIERSMTEAERFTMKLKSKPVVNGEMTPEMFARELAARETYEKKMKPRIGPAFNKSGDMYLSESELAAEKKGELRRRS